MKPPIYLSASIKVFLMMIGLDLSGGQNRQNPQSDYSDYNLNNQGFDQSQYDSYNDVDEGVTLEYKCYSCTFHVRSGNAAGLDNCRDPFVKIGIPEVPCQGTCAKIYHKTSATEYTVTRICLPNCKDVKDEKGYTECCWGHLCNGSNSMNTMKGTYLTMILGLLVISFTMAFR